MLDRLKSDAFFEEVGLCTSASALRRVLERSETVKGVRDAIAGGAITEVAIRRFVDELSNDFEKGEQFPHELPLAALCVAIEDRRTEFTEEFLLHLARLRIVEMPIAPEVARESYLYWQKLPREHRKNNEVAALGNQPIQTDPRPIAFQNMPVVAGESRFIGSEHAIT